MHENTMLSESQNTDGNFCRQSITLQSKHVFLYRLSVNLK